MENLNLRIGADAGRNITKLVDQINSACASLIDTLTLQPQAVGNYGTVISQKLDSEFVDRIVTNLTILQKHLTNLRTKIDTDMDKEWVEEITKGLMETSDKLNEFVISNNFFYTTFGRSVEEIRKMIGKILDRMPIGVAVMN